MSSLYHLSEGLLALMNDEESEEEEINERLKALCEGINSKGDSIAQFVKSLKAQGEALSGEIQDLQNRKKVTENKIDRIKEYARENMEKLGLGEVGDLHKLKICKNGGKLPLLFDFDVEDSEKVVEFCPPTAIKTVHSPDNEEIRNMLDTGSNIPMIKYGERGTHLRIK